MSVLRHIPLKYRLPLIHGFLWGLAATRWKAWPRASASDAITPGPLIVSGFHNESSGIAQGAKDIVTAFNAVDLPLIVHDIRPAFSHFVKCSATFPTDAPGGVWIMPINPAETVIALMAYPIEQWAGRYRIGYWAWETTRAPRTWVWIARFLHEIWVPGQFVYDAVKAAFEAAGEPELTQKLRVMLHPLPDFDNVTPDRPAFNLDEDVCEVLCLFDMKSAHTRKNPWAVLEAWRRAFYEPTPGARLHLKVQNLADDPETHERLLSLMRGRNDIRLFEERLSDEDMRIFIASFDALISLHRSEGFGLTLAEAMGMNVAVVATGWSGNMAFMDADNSYLIPSTLKPVEDPSGMYGGFLGSRDPKQLWAEPNIAASAEALRDLVEIPDTRKQKVATARAGIYQRLNAPWTLEALKALPFFRHLAEQ